MMQSPDQISPAPEAHLVPLPRIAAFVRQLTHDVRNNLNSIDLQAAYITELVTDPEATGEVRRLRDLVQLSARQLSSISSNFQATSPNRVTYTAGILIEDLRERLQKLFPEQAGKVAWEVTLGEEGIEVDVEALFGALTELFRNAFQFQREQQAISARAFTEGRSLALEITEEKAEPPVAPEAWGTEPFVSSRAQRLWPRSLPRAPACSRNRGAP